MKTKQDVADYLAASIKRSGKTQLQIARESGFPTANVISMMKNNQLKIPLCRIPALSKSLGVDPRELLSNCLEAYEPELHDLLSTLTPSLLITDKEFRVVRALRAASKAGVFAV